MSGDRNDRQRGGQSQGQTQGGRSRQQQHQQDGREQGQQVWGQRSPQNQQRTRQDTVDGNLEPLDGEEVIIDARPAWSAYLLYLIVAALFLLGGLISGDAAGIAGGLIVAVLIVGYIFYRRRRVRYVVTDRRMMIVRGISSKSTNEVWMVDVVNLQTGASFLERLLGHGHITVSRQIQPGGLSFTGIGGMTFGGIENHEEIAQTIRERQNADKL